MDCKVNWRGGVCRKGEVSGICHLQAATKTGYIGKKPVSGQVAFTTSVSMVSECQSECACVSAVGASDETVKSTTMLYCGPRPPAAETSPTASLRTVKTHSTLILCNKHAFFRVNEVGFLHKTFDTTTRPTSRSPQESYSECRSFGANILFICSETTAEPHRAMMVMCFCQLTKRLLQ